MLLFNVGGDDQNVIPQIMRVPADRYEQLSHADQWAKGVEHDRYDVVKLAQWQRALSYAAELGLQVHFKMQEVENSLFMRSVARRVGKEWVLTCRSRWSPYHSNQNTSR